ncbi:MAG: DUF6514 family protein [Defluviitaleaceae bacterium]|nr:DUF6514 family protein [Defluviitaleaceae bacterium]
MVEKFLQESILVRTEDNKVLKLNYYVTKNKSSVYGIAINKYQKLDRDIVEPKKSKLIYDLSKDYLSFESKNDENFALVESAETVGITYSRTEAFRICNLLATRSVMPCTVDEIIEDLEIYSGSVLDSDNSKLLG